MRNVEILGGRLSPIISFNRSCDHWPKSFCLASLGNCKCDMWSRFWSHFVLPQLLWCKMYRDGYAFRSYNETSGGDHLLLSFHLLIEPKLIGEVAIRVIKECHMQKVRRRSQHITGSDVGKAVVECCPQWSKALINNQSPKNVNRGEIARWSIIYTHCKKIESLSHLCRSIFHCWRMLPDFHEVEQGSVPGASAGDLDLAG